eukprot:gene16616-22704_t
MSERDYLLIAENDLHKIPIDRLFLKFETSPDGLSTALARTKRGQFQLNYVKPPFTPPAWLCCLLPCFLSMESVAKYGECVPDFALVKRNDKWINLDCLSIVPGDIVRISAGERVPADIRIISANGCIFDGTSVMGKSNLINTDVNPQELSESYLDSPNVAFLGYLCVAGDCTGVVIATGSDTVLSKLISSKSWPPFEY